MSRPDDHVTDLVDDYLHQLLEPPEADHVESHCETCPPCKEALEAARKRKVALKAVPPCEASGELLRATLGRIDAHDRGQRRLRRRLAWGVVGALAASVLVVGALHFHYANLSATPYDLVVLGQRNLLAATTGSLRVRLLDRNTNAPLAGVPVAVELRSTRDGRAVELDHFSTDAHGSGQPHFTLPDWAEGDYQLCVTARTRGRPEVVTRPVHLARSWKLMLSSDKPVYQPGQEIHVRSLMLRRLDLKPVADQPATFSIADPKGNVIFKQQGKTSRHGISAADCALAQEILEGPYTITCKVGDTESRLAVEVKKYVLPKFKVDVQTDRRFYQPGEKARCTVQADYFFGKHVADARVVVEVKSADGQSATLEAKTDAAGKAEVEYRVPDSLPGREQDSGRARIAFQVRVTDSAGQEQTGTADRVVTTQPVHIDVLPEGGTLVQGVPNTVYVLTTHADGSPARTRLAISGVGKERDTDDLGVAAVEVTPTTPELTWTLRAMNPNGEVVSRRHVQMTCGRFQDDFLVRTDKAVYRGGDTLKLTVLGGGGAPVFVDFLKDGQTLLTETIDLANGRGEHSFDLPPEVFGTVQVCAYRLNLDAVPVRKTRVVYVDPAGQLNIKTTLDRQEYRPGARAKLHFTLTDAQGAPCAGALSLAAVDEAVFSVLQQAPGMEKTFYTLEQQLLKPVYAVYPWAPGKTLPGAEPARERFEQALFSTTACTDGGPGPRRKHIDNGTPPGPSPHSLSANTFPSKVQEASRDRAVGLQRMRTAWWMIFAITLVAGYASLWCFFPVEAVFKVHLVGFVLLFPVVILIALSSLGSGGRAPPGPTAMFDDSESMPVATAEKSAPTPGPMAPAAGREAAMEEPAPTAKPSDPAGPRPPNPGQGEADVAEPVRVREKFPETLLWRPELITDDAGNASIDLDLTDSITTWRLSASAIAADGRLGAAQVPFKVFQPFFVDLNLPVALTRGDEVAVPVVVYNYLDRPQTISLTLADGDWFERLGGAEQRLDLAAGEVRSVHYRLRVRKVGNHDFTVTGRGGQVADAVKRTIEVLPDGLRVEQVFNGTLRQPVEITLAVPDEAIEGSVKAIVKVYPSSFSQLVEGLDNIFRLPSGCFEQTSSTTYPNVLALDYLKRTKQSVPQVEAKARQYIHLGYQRLLGFEVQGGGFDWFGHPPANRTLTAYGLMEFEDMARVHDVDPRLIERTRGWLLGQRLPDGSWKPEGHALHEDPTRGRGGDQARLATTAYIAWAVFAHGDQAGQGGVTLDYLLAHRPSTIKDPHVLALVGNALLALDPQGREAGPYLDRLDALKRTGEDGKLAWWEQEAGARTTFYGAGRSGSIETTALAALALVGGKRHADTARAALTWLATQKDANGTWHSTQATVLSLKALLAGTGEPFGAQEARRIQVRLGDTFKDEIVIPADQAEVMKQLDLSRHLAGGTRQLRLTETSDTAAGYQVSFRYHVPAGGRAEKPEPLAVELDYDRTELAVGESIRATARVVNRMPQSAAMVMLDLPVPAGFVPAAEDFAGLVKDGKIARFQVQARSVLVYLRDLPPGRPLALTYHLHATMPVKITAPGARVYEYYDPDRQGRCPGVKLTVTGRE